MKSNASSQAVQQGLLHHREGRLDPARKSYERALQLDPKNSDALHLLGLLTAAQGDADAGIALLEKALRLQPVFPAAWFNLGNLLQKADRLPEAERAYRKALSFQPKSVDFLRNLGSTLMRSENYSEAAKHYEKAHALDPQNVELCHNFGLSHLKLGHLDEARSCFLKALALNPAYVPALEDLGSTLLALQRPAEAADTLQTALQLSPVNAATWCALGNCHKKLLNLDEALRCYQKASELDPYAPEPPANTACVHIALGAFDQAEGLLRQVLHSHPEFSPASWNLAITLLSQGNYEEGWPAYEARWTNEFMAKARRDFDLPLWLGETSAQGRSILVHAEQGFGDTLQFIRFIPLLAAQGATVHLQVQQSLLRLLAKVPGAASVTALTTPPTDCDCHCPLLSLPLALGITLESLPAQVPYVQPPEELLPPLAPSPAERPCSPIGLTWSGNPEHDNDASRSLPLELLKGLISTSRHPFYVLQKDIRDSDLAALAELPGLIDRRESFADFADTAALATQMDLIITVDTSLAHLAGSLGKETWLLLPANADWRWLRNRTDSPWYPTLRLFRQTSLGDWSPVIEELATLLKAREVPA